MGLVFGKNIFENCSCVKSRGKILGKIQLDNLTLHCLKLFSNNNILYRSIYMGTARPPLPLVPIGARYRMHGSGIHNKPKIHTA